MRLALAAVAALAAAVTPLGASATGAFGYRVKDKLENRLHDLVCSGTLELSDVRKGIAGDWKKLYAKVVKP